MTEQGVGFDEVLREIREDVAADLDGNGVVRAYRRNWNGTKLDGPESMFIRLVHPEGMLPCLSLRTPGGEQVPWLATSTDLLATDWFFMDADAPAGDS